MPLWVVMPNHVHMIVVIDGGKVTHVDTTVIQDGVHTVSTNARWKDQSMTICPIDLPSVLSSFGGLMAHWKTYKITQESFGRDEKCEEIWEGNFIDCYGWGLMVGVVGWGGKLV